MGIIFSAAQLGGSARFRRWIIVALLCRLCLACGPPSCPVENAPPDRQSYQTGGEAYPDGRWSVNASEIPTRAQPGDVLQWHARFELKSSAVRAYAAKIDEIKLVLAARRLCDAEGHYRDQDGYFTSTYLTPSGLPIEGYQYLIANSRIGGPYRTPLDVVQDVPRAAIRVAGDRLSFSLPVKAPLTADFPAGLFRIEMAFYASIDGHWVYLPVLGAVDSKNISGCNPKYETRYFYRKIFLPPLHVGPFRQPRAIWTLFTSVHSYAVSGVVAREDAPHFAMSNRLRLQGRYILPCTPDRQTCTFAIEPDMPTISAFKTFIFYTKGYDYDALEIDYERGDYTVRIERPDGRVDDLGKRRFSGKSWYGPRVDGGPPKYDFDKFGKYEIHMAGEIFDRFGNRFEAGGTYEVWVAYPLTFTTAIKPGTPMKVGGSYSIAATINPPVPAEVTATVRFYPGLHPQDAVEAIRRGTAQKFGYFFPDPAEKPLFFPEQGEYLFDIFATYAAPDGRFYMGNMRNASVVISDQDTLNIVGETLPVSFDAARPFNDIASQYANVFFPRKSGDIFRFFGNAAFGQLINPDVSVEEPTGRLQRALDESFPPGLINLHARADELRYAASRGALFPGSQEMMRVYGKEYGGGSHLPLMSATPVGYSPFEYPELVDRRGYFYIAASRPGFPVFFVVATSAINENYWAVGGGNYGGTIGAAMRGDQPGDVYWSVISGMFADARDKQEYYGQYSAAGVAALRGDYAIFDDSATLPVAHVNGVDLGIMGGVGPAAGAMFETGAVKGIGTIAVPMAPHNVEVQIVKPDGETFDCRGRADRLGNFFCPNGPFVYDRPGVYRVFARFIEGDRAGVVPGARGGWYQTYAVAHDTAYRVAFDRILQKPIAYESPFHVTGAVDPPLRSGRVFYSIVAPGILIDEGSADLTDGRFHLVLYPDQIGAQFANLHDHPGTFQMHISGYPQTLDLSAVRRLFAGYKRRVLSDTIEVTVFVEGVGADGKPATAGGKFVLRGNRAMIPSAFLAAAHGASR